MRRTIGHLLREDDVKEQKEKNGFLKIYGKNYKIL